MTSKYIAYVISDLYDAGRDMDGQCYIADCYYVVAEDEHTGRRFAHDHRFFGAKLCVDDDGEYGYEDIRKEQSAKADALCDKINARLKKYAFEISMLNLAHWEEIDPAYGSDAWISQGTDAKRYHEERQLETKSF
jgi:hypothetical protein